LPRVNTALVGSAVSKAVSGADPWFGVALQLGWIVALWALATVLWRAGLRQYESVGG